MKHKYVGLITVRTSSSRLPQKTLSLIGDKSLIEHVITRAKESLDVLSNVVVCTSTEVSDDCLETIAKELGVDCFRGSLNDKIARWRGAVKEFGADYMVSIDGDDPFCDPELIKLAINQVEKTGADVVTADAEGYVCGGFTHIISAKTLDKICEMKDTEDTEMTKPYLIGSGKFNVKMLEVPDLFKDSTVRLTLDYPEDLDFFRRVFVEMNMKENTVPLREILNFLKKRPDLVAINFFRQNDFKVNQVKTENFKLKK